MSDRKPTSFIVPVKPVALVSREKQNGCHIQSMSRWSDCQSNTEKINCACGFCED